MAFKCDVTRVAAITGGGPTQDITIADFGTPKAAILIITRAVTDGTAAAHAVMSIGLADGTTEKVTGFRDEDGIANSDSDRRATSNESIMVLGLSTQVDAEADFNSWITDGIRISWGNLPDDNYFVQAILFGGDDISNVDVDSFSADATEDNTVGVTGVGFEPDLVFFLSPGSDLGFTDANKNHGGISFGAAINDGSETQRAYGTISNTGSANAACFQWFRTNRIASMPAGPSDITHELTSFDADGFTVATRDGSDAVAIAFLAIKFSVGTVNSWLGTYQTPSGTGNDAKTGVGFQPDAVILAVGDSAQLDGAAETIGYTNGIAAFTPDNEYCSAVSSEDAAATMNTQSLSDDTAIHIPHDDGADQIVASYVSMDADGFTLNYSDVGAGQRYCWALALGEAGAGATHEGAATVAGVGAIAQAAGTLLLAASVAVAGVGGISASGTVVSGGTATVAGVGQIVAAAGVERAGTVTVAGVGAIVADGSVARGGTATIAGVGTISAAGASDLAGAATVAGVGDISANGALDLAGSATVAGIGSIVADGETGAQHEGAAALAGVGGISAASAADLAGTATVAGVGQIVAGGVLDLGGSSTIAGVGTISAAGETGAQHEGAATIAGVGAIVASGALDQAGSATLAGVGQIVADGEIGGQLEGAATVAGVGQLVAASSLDSVGSSTVAGVGALTATAGIDRPGAATVAGVGALVASGAVIRGGAATVAGVGQLSAAAVMERVAVATVAGVGQLSAGAALDLGGVATVAGVGSIIAAGLVPSEEPASATIAGVGTLTAAGLVYKTPASRILIVPGDDRTLIVPRDDRTLIVPEDDRELIVRS